MSKKAHPKAYAALNHARERCVYEAFANVTTTPAATLGQWVNDESYDADDTEGADLLARRFEFTGPELVRGEAFVDGNYNFDCSAQFIVLIANGAAAAARDALAGLLPTTGDYATSGNSKLSAKDVMFDDRFESIQWHAVYGTSDGNFRMTWYDVQNVYPNGPIRGTIFMVYIRKPIRPRV
jgi:hypothetical protein